MEEQTMEKEGAVKKEYGSYLENRKVRILPVESNGKWASLLVKGEERKKDPFLYNKVKRSLDCPLNPQRLGGGIKRILDDSKRVLIKKYETEYPHGMTQQEFFEKELEVNLNPSLPIEDNFWRSDRAKRNKVFLTKEGLILSLSNSLDMLKYLILLANEQKVAPNYESRRLKASYEWMLVDEGKVISAKVEKAETKAKAYTKFAEVISSEASMVDFIKSLGRTVPANRTTDWLKSEVLKVIENDPNYFLTIIEDPYYKDKVFIQDAVEAGSIRRMGDKRYVLDNGVELGDIVSVINWVNDPDNQEAKFRIKNQIGMSKQ